MAETYQQRMKRIELEDFIRKCEREQRELDILFGRHTQVPEGIDAYHYSRSQTCEPSNKNRTYRVAPNSWRNHNYKTADGRITSKPMRSAGSDVTVTHADGSSEVRSATSFRKDRSTSSRRTKVVQAQQAQTYAERVAQLGAIGNID